MSNFSAQEAALGFFYQARYALLFLLDSDEEKELILESLDDIVLGIDGTPVELLQTKHHVRQQARLTDTSPELWKTIRIWSSHLRDNRISFPEVRLLLITTATAPEGSIAALLRPGSRRNPNLARERLLSAAACSSSEDKPLRASFAAFQELSQDQQQALADAIHVIDRSPDISDTADLIRRQIRAAGSREHRSAIFERLEGWWFGKVVEQLNAADPLPISGIEVYDKLSSIAKDFLPEALPIDFLDAKPDSVDAQGDSRLFVEQLRIIELSQKRIEKAIVDYYRAYQQRSRWARDQLLVGGEVKAYEEKLVDEWERFSSAVTEELSNGPGEEYLRRIGRKIFNWMEFTANIRIRPKVAEAYVMRGSYHMLANKPQPRVWWHPNFLQHLAEIVGLTREN